MHSTNCSTLSDFCTTFYWYANFILNNFILTSWSQPWIQHITETSSKYVRLKLGWPLNLAKNGMASESVQSWDDLIRPKLEWPLNSSKAGMTSESVRNWDDLYIRSKLLKDHVHFHDASRTFDPNHFCITIILYHDSFFKIINLVTRMIRCHRYLIWTPHSESSTVLK